MKNKNKGGVSGTHSLRPLCASVRTWRGFIEVTHRHRHSVGAQVQQSAQLCTPSPWNTKIGGRDWSRPL